MRNLVLTLAAVFCVQLSFSQVKNIEYSTPFEEPEKGWYKIMQLSNGNTFFFNFNNEKGIEITVYKPDRKVGAKKVLSSSLWDPQNMKNSTIEGIYEIAGQPVIFLQQLNSRVPELYRIQLNPDNGAIAQQKKLGELPKYGMMAGYAMAFGGVDQEDFIVEKDPYSDAYAIVHYNSFAKESGKRIELVHYAVENGEHKEINRAFYDAQDFKYTNYIGMVVNGDKQVHLAAYGYNTSGSGGKDSRVIISRIRKGESEFTNLNLEFTDDFKETEGLMNYNPQTGMIQMLTLTYLKSSGTTSYYMVLISFIDPESLQIIRKALLPMEEVNNYVKSKNIDKKGFTGMPVDMILNNDNTSTILLEEKSEIISRSSTIQIPLGNIAVVTVDGTGKDIESYAIQKCQEGTSGQSMENMYLAKRGKGMWSYRKRTGMSMTAPLDNRAFYSFGYVNTSSNNKYIIFNDNRDNYENGVPKRQKNNSVLCAASVSDAVTVFRKVNNSGMESGYLFGRNANDDQTAFANVESAHFRKDTGVYAALMVKRVKREKKAYISWVTLE
ncbi:MAG: hypothetical protein K8F30_10800 [Taibaiella sp.]|nr:hypothetical protein [Taibaiella sp.]